MNYGEQVVLEKFLRVPAGKVAAPKAGAVKVCPTNNVANIAKTEAKKKKGSSK